uniref:Uncharacterized protein n=1 Tax=Glossina austeni TaxID=7395 RepID=A0A1A9UT17_GLOAU
MHLLKPRCYDVDVPDIIFLHTLQQLNKINLNFLLFKIKHFLNLNNKQKIPTAWRRPGDIKIISLNVLKLSKRILNIDSEAIHQLRIIHYEVFRAIRVITEAIDAIAPLHYSKSRSCVLRYVEYLYDVVMF